jgi:tetratricopeptide (TPR) repeat protein
MNIISRIILLAVSGFMLSGNTSYADNDKAQIYLSIAENAFGCGNNHEAIANFTAAIALEPELSHAALTKAFFNRAIAKGNIGDQKGSMLDFVKAIELDPTPKNAEAYLSRAVAKNAIGDTKGAAADYNKALELSSGKAESCYGRNKVAYGKSIEKETGTGS